MINPELKVGDRVVLLHMEGENIMPGSKGTVTNISKVFGEIIYAVDWDNGSKLSICADVDAWDTEENRGKFKKKIKEYEIRKKDITESSEMERMNRIIANQDVFKYFNSKFLREYLFMIRDSGIVNMFGAAPYLYMGKDRIAHEFVYNEPPDEESFEKVLENANQAQAEMINGVLKYLEANNKEGSLENVNRYLSSFARKILELYIIIQ